MVWVDYLIIAIVAASMLISLFRGFVKEVMSLVTWLLAFWIAVRFAVPFSDYLETYISTPSARLGLSYVLLFIGVLTIGTLVTHIAAMLIKATPLAAPDRILGSGFGALRGFAVVTALVIAAGMTPVKQDPWWNASFIIPHVEAVADFCTGLMPDDIAHKLRMARVQVESAPELVPTALPTTGTGG